MFAPKNQPMPMSILRQWGKHGRHSHCCIRGLLSACPQVCGHQSAARNVIVGGLLPGWLSAFYGQRRG